MKKFYNNLSHQGKRFFIGFAFIFLSIIFIQALELAWHGVQTFKIRYEAIVLSYDNINSNFNVLIAGDSIGVGVGASKPEDSISGIFIKNGASVLNVSYSGDKTYEVLNQVKNIDSRKHFDLALLFVGGNDVLWFRNINDAQNKLRDLIFETKKRSDKVVVIPPGNVGLAPMFREPIGIFYTGRARNLSDRFRQVSKEEGVIYIDTFSNNLAELFQDEPLKYFASDLLHPSSEGYRVWYDKIIREAGIWY